MVVWFDSGCDGWAVGYYQARVVRVYLNCKNGQIARVVFYRPDEAIDENLNGRDLWGSVDLRKNNVYLSRLPRAAPGER